MNSQRYPLLLISAAVLIASAAIFVMSAAAEPDDPGVSNAFCLDCHGDPATTMTLDNGDTISLYIDVETFEHSVHGQEGYACVQCHTDIREYPHPPFSAFDPRDVSLDLYDACFRCHSKQYERALDSVHERALENGIVEAAICTDCHGAHDTQRLTDPQTGRLLPSARTNIPVTCSQCHSAIYQKYRESVHGSALTEENNQDVPTCINCHGVHNIGDPTTARFRLRSPQICANCHTNEALMSKYGLSTDVLNTYVSDFHGTTVTIFRKVTPDAATNKAVCYDCHGVHDIRRVDDPQKGLQVRENLLARCQVCHPDATADFSDSWLSHYIPSPERNALVYYVNLFYKFFIPGVLGGMGVLVALDASWQIRRRFFKPRPGKTAEAHTPESQSELDTTRDQIWGEPAKGPSETDTHPTGDANGERGDMDTDGQQGDSPSTHE
ncbi:MAG: cytochrome c3 family protein [Anaerolineales bacterium]